MEALHGSGEGSDVGLTVFSSEMKSVTELPSVSRVRGVENGGAGTVYADRGRTILQRRLGFPRLDARIRA